jgi:hypothetical protein
MGRWPADADTGHDGSRSSTRRSTTRRASSPTLGEDVARQIDALADDDRPGEGYLAHVRRLMMARIVAKETILSDRVLRTRARSQ